MNDVDRTVESNLSMYIICSNQYKYITQATLDEDDYSSKGWGLTFFCRSYILGL